MYVGLGVGWGSAYAGERKLNRGREEGKKLAGDHPLRHTDYFPFVPAASRVSVATPFTFPIPGICLDLPVVALRTQDRRRHQRPAVEP